MRTVTYVPVDVGDPLEGRILLGATAVTVLLAGAVAFAGTQVFLVFPLIAFVALFVFVMRNPIWAAYIYVAAVPFIGGIDRGVIPLVRPNEALQGFLMVAVAVGAVARAGRGESLRMRLTRLDIAVIAVAILGSVWPICWMLLRGETPSSSDVFSTIVLWRLAALYALFRWVVRTTDDIRRCLWILLGTACVLAILAVLTGRGLLQLVGPWASGEQGDRTGTGRGVATLNSSIAVGDYLAYTFGVALLWFVKKPAQRVGLGLILGVLIVGSLGTGQFSAWIAMGIVLLVVARSERQLAPLLKWCAPLGLVAAVAAWPIVATRLSGFSSSFGVPQSWVGRIDNVTNFYVPRLSGFNWVLGVRPDSVLQAPETWRESIWMESGLLWFFWVGGVPLFLGIVWFSYRAFKHTKHVWATRDDDVAVAALAARGALWCILLLGVIDMHLTLRGGGDLFFILLGLSANRIVPVRPRPGVFYEPQAAEFAFATGSDTVTRTRPKTAGFSAKRCMDVTISLAAIVLLSPVLLVVAIAVRCSSRGPVLFRQARIGYDERPFYMLKFRSMTVAPTDDTALREAFAAEVEGRAEADESGSYKLADTSRITPIGKLIRATSVDELPQLFNVLRGEMSLVGPRPAVDWEVELFPAQYDRRASVLPGITGLWQVSGRSRLSALEMLELDVQYVDERTLASDFRILCKTPLALLRGDGAK